MEEQQIKRIDAYLKNELSAAERGEFEAEAENNPELKQELSESILAMKVMDLEAEKDLRSKFSNWKQPSKKGVIRSLVVRYSAIAASIVLLIGLFLYFNKPDSDVRLAMRNYIRPDAPENTMGGDDQYWQEGIGFYKQNKFSEALNSWERIDHPDAEVQYYIAHCYYNLQNFEKAASVFLGLSEGTSTYTYVSEWYLLLTYLSIEDTKKFNKRIEKIRSNASHPYKKDAEKLKSKADKINRM